MTAAEEDRIRRRKAMEEAAKVRSIYEEMVLKKSQSAVVQIGSVEAIKAATVGGNGNGNGDGEVKVEPATLVQ